MSESGGFLESKLSFVSFLGTLMNANAHELQELMTRIRRINANWELIELRRSANAQELMTRIRRLNTNWDLINIPDQPIHTNRWHELHAINMNWDLIEYPRSANAHEYMTRIRRINRIES